VYLLKDKHSYLKLFEILHQNKAFPVAELGKVMSDFEKTLMAAVQESIPWAEVRYFFVSFSVNNYLLTTFNSPFRK
jgi:hypothetical protein